MMTAYDIFHEMNAAMSCKVRTKAVKLAVNNYTSSTYFLGNFMNGNISQTGRNYSNSY